MHHFLHPGELYAPIMVRTIHFNSYNGKQDVFTHLCDPLLTHMCVLVHNAALPIIGQMVNQFETILNQCCFFLVVHVNSLCYLTVADKEQTTLILLVLYLL